MERRETAGLTMRLIVEFIRDRHGESAVARMLELAGETRPVEMLQDESVWSSYDQKISLFAAAAAVTGRPGVAREIGETVLDSSVATTLKVALGMLGSPASLLRVVTRASGKFSTAGDMKAHRVSRTGAVIRYRIRDGFALSRHDCDYSIGLLTRVPVLFGLPPAEVDHDECQIDGADACIYRMRWSPRRRLPWRRPPDRLAAEALLARLHQLQETLADLVTTTDVDDVLDAIASRARSAVSAERFVLAVTLDEGTSHVRSDGLDEVAAREVAAALLEGQRLPVDADDVLVVEVATSTRAYGRLAAFASFPFLDQEQQLFEAYGRLAATALEAVTALTVAEDRRRTAEALLELAGRLHRAHTGRDISVAVAQAVQTVADADAASVLLFKDEASTLRNAGQVGWPDDLARVLEDMEIHREDTPELDDILTRPDRPRIYDDTTQDLYIRGMFDVFRTRMVAVAPIHGSDHVHGVVIAGWFEGSAPPPSSGPLLARLSGLANQAANALDKAELVEQVRLQAATDSLTGLANRRLLAERLRGAAAYADPGTTPALLFVDLDRFKLINDSLGHGAGDELLRVVADRLRRTVRTDDLVARLGGDEFTILLSAVNDAETALEVGAQVVAELAQPITLEGRTVHVRSSVGVLLLDSGHRTASEALREADAAMYAAKKSGGNCCVLFDPAHLGAEGDELELEADLYRAVDEEALYLAYQPQINLVTGDLVGVECLVRWDHPVRGSIPPLQFLPLAEATGLIVPIDLWVLRTACRQGARWWDLGFPLRVAVNVSARTLVDPRFLAAVREELRQSGLPAEAIEIELTEATAIADPEAVRNTLLELRRLGSTVALDDLGTAYSSLSWISSFPVDRIKIDRSFVADLDTGGRGEPLVEALIAMAHGLGHGVVAEGVETDAQRARLESMGCPVAQGYLLGRPGPADAITRRLLPTVEPVGAGRRFGP